MSRPLESPNPLAGAVLAVLKAARETHIEITKAKLVRLLYLADLDAIESGRTQFSGATWRWDDYGPYDHALVRAEEWVMESELVERRDTRSAEDGSHALSLTVDIEDPLNVADMECVRNVVRLYGGRSATGLKDLSYETAPMVEARAGGERGALLDLNRARRREQVAVLRERFRSRRGARPPQQDDPGVGDALVTEFLEARDGLRRANAKILDDR
ncbi:Uncharacterized phage-associated protein [Streptosporangium canum]|uniref:Uncharacterized phage-associated protein n=1 Tax=Streptosporangium canum TaxID=324952 RepID=A0A1I4EFF0_9ACTN|nr:hypothetical protein [Streptosporangium canum]SFL02911.1 Uncharacterized phage-associated protein [Streptosporangium canum]